MAKGMPSMVALLGLLALAGYQNRDKIAGALKDSGLNLPSGTGPVGQAQGGLGGVLSGLGGLLGGDASGSSVRGGLGDLLDRFKQGGQAEVADSWVTTGPNRGLEPHQVEEAIGAENLEELSRRTGLSKEDLLTRLATSIPEAVDKMTPDGRLPTDEEATRYL